MRPTSHHIRLPSDSELASESQPSYSDALPRRDSSIARGAQTQHPILALTSSDGQDPLPPRNSSFNHFYNPPRSPTLESPDALSAHFPRRKTSTESLFSDSSSFIPHSPVGVSGGRVGTNYGPYSHSSAQLLNSSSQSVNSFSPSLASPSLHSDAGFDEYLDANEHFPSSKEELEWDFSGDKDDYIHDPAVKDPKQSFWQLWTLRGWLNATALLLIVLALIGIFAAYPLTSFFLRASKKSAGWGLGGVNGTGQVPSIPNFPSLIDTDTPMEARTRTGFDGFAYSLVFSDEFNVDNRSFYPGDDPFWEAVDLHYWGTDDLEWYDPSAATTYGGSLLLELSQTPNHGLDYQSGMIQSWNKLCFTGGYIEVSVVLPGQNNVVGYWPGAWTIGNLARAGYGATTDGVWPYSYDSCDTGSRPNQTNADGVTPTVALTSGDPQKDNSLSYQPGQRLSSCTCSGEDHPGPNTNFGRGGPEIDIIEAQISWNETLGGLLGSVSQSGQIAPYNTAWQFLNNTPNVIVYDNNRTLLNDYKGGVYQQALSGVTYTPPNNYAQEGGAFATYGFEYHPDRENGYITWQTDGQPAWTITSNAIGPDAQAEISNRLVSEEPMSIVLNFGFSNAFQAINFREITFPATFAIDYVRIYQRDDLPQSVTCDPASHPTHDYIQRHINAYTNPNLTTWEQAGSTFPRSSQDPAGC